MKRILILLGFILVLCMSCQILSWKWEADSRFVSYPGWGIEKTAQYLYDNPLPTPTEHYFDPEPGTIITTLDLEHEFSVCATGHDMLYSEWIVNGVRVPSWMNNRFIMCTLGPPEWTCPSNCFSFRRALEKGLNLVEIRTHSFFFHPYLPFVESEFVYQWAFIIEASNPTPTFTPYPPYIPPTPTP